MSPLLPELLPAISQRRQHSRVVNLRSTRLYKVVRIAVGLALAILVSAAVVRGALALGRQVSEPRSDITACLPAMGLMGAGWLLVLALVELMDRRWHVYAEHTRKLAHVGAGLIALFAPAVFPTHWPMLFLAIVFSVILVLSRRLRLVRPLHDGSRESLGDVIYPGSLYMLFLLAEGNALLFQIPILVLTMADASAALVGQRYGRLRYRVTGNTRSLEGSLAFVMVAFLAILVPVLVSGRVEGMGTVLFAGVIAVAIAVIEAVCPQGLDNFFIPVGTLFLLEGLLPMASPTFL
jgi:phytol kinase